MEQTATRWTRTGYEAYPDCQRRRKGVEPDAIEIWFADEARRPDETLETIAPLRNDPIVWLPAVAA